MDGGHTCAHFLNTPVNIFLGQGLFQIMEYGISIPILKSLESSIDFFFELELMGKTGGEDHPVHMLASRCQASTSAGLLARQVGSVGNRLCEWSLFRKCNLFPFSLIPDILSLFTPPVS